MIRAYIGLLGSGKTLSMVYDAIPFVLQGKKVISNTPFFISDSRAKPDAPNYKTLGGKVGYGPDLLASGADFQRAFYNESDCLFLIDEAAIILSAYDWNKMPFEVVMRFAQARKYGVDIFYTSQSLSHTVRRLRDLTNEVVKCRFYNLFGMIQIIKNKVYDPEYYLSGRERGPKTEPDYLLDTRTLWPWQLKKLYKQYDTMYKVAYSLWGKSDENRQVNQNEEFTLS